MSPKRLLDVLANLRRNGALGRVELAFVLATMVEWSGWLALVVYAFDRGGAAEAGLIGVRGRGAADPHRPDRGDPR